MGQHRWNESADEEDTREMRFLVEPQTGEPKPDGAGIVVGVFVVCVLVCAGLSALFAMALGLI